jgi:hypothetical protein
MSLIIYHKYMKQEELELGIDGFLCGKERGFSAGNRRGRVKIGMHETERENAVITKSR